MSTSSYSAGGLSVKEFKLYVTEAGQWLWGTVQGAWNEKQTLSQIITDAVIGMIPVVGDVTAARDLIAVGSGLANNPEKREHVTEWVLLVILIFALIPIVGGVIKGVGRIALRVTEQAAADSKAIAKIAEEVITFLNHIGHKNAEAWFKALNVLKYEGEIIAKFRTLCDTLIIALNRCAFRFKNVLPQSLLSRMEQLANGFKTLKQLGDKRIPQALKDLHERLSYLQKVIHSGGVPPPDKAKIMLAQTGRKTVTYAEEARLIESGAVKKVVHAGKYKQNVAATKKVNEIGKVYTHSGPYPNLLQTIETDVSTGISYYRHISAASGKISNELLRGETLFRFFGAKGVTHGETVEEAYAMGSYWGRGAVPKTPERFRVPSAILDEFNRDGWVCLMHIPKGVQMPACTSTVAEQFSKKIAGQYLEGGGPQAVITKFFEDAKNNPANRKIIDDINNLWRQGHGAKLTLPNGVTFEVRKTGWHKNEANGKIGYGETVIPGASITERLGITERQTKVASQTAQGTAKHERANQH